jgi:transposase
MVRTLYQRRRRWSSRPAQIGPTARSLSGEQRIALIGLACRPPSIISHWSAAELREAFAASADGADIGTRTVARVLDEAEIQPHRIRYFLTSRDPEFDQKRRDIVGLYLRPPEDATVLCLDEKPSIQALGRKNPDLPLRPGLPLYREFEYVRHGVVHLFAAFNTRSGRVLGEVQNKKTRFEFIELLDLCAWHYKRGQVHCVLDNAQYHKAPEVKDWLAAHPRFHFHFTPTHGSWLNQVELWFQQLSSKVLRRGVFNSTAELHSAIMAFISHWDGNPQRFNWVYGAEFLDEKERLRAA